MSRQMHASIVEDANGPGPRCALIYKKNAEPKKRKLALTMEGAASMYFPTRMSWTVAVWSICARAKVASLIPKLAHPRKKQHIIIA